MMPTFNIGRILVAVTIALAGSVVIWLAVPYNNFWLQNNFISDDFLPVIVVTMLLLLVLTVNPLLRLLGEGWMLNRRQLALIGALLLFASVIPGTGLMRFFPRMVAATNQQMNTSLQTAQIAADAHFRQALFPDPLPSKDKQGNVVMHRTPNSDAFTYELDVGQSVPWSAWVVPMATWGALIVAMWTMMLGLGGVVFPQWRERERLPFPLLNVYTAFIGDPNRQEQRLLPAIFSTRSFWVAAGIVFLIHALRGLSVFTGSFPSVPLSWDLSSYYSDSILRFSTLALKRQHILFLVVGVAYFIPSRYAFSIWFWILVQGLYITLGRAYTPTFNSWHIFDQTFGALLAIAVWVLWLGRAHWAEVGRAMLGRASGGPHSVRDAVAGWMFALGCAGIVCWLVWAGCSLWWSILATAGCAIVSLLMTRIIAETGIPIFWIPYFTVGSLTSLFPLSWQSPTILFFSAVFSSLLSRTTAVSAAVISTLALGIDREASPSYRSRLLPGGLMLMIAGFVVCGGVHLYMGYHNADISTTVRTSASAIQQWSRLGMNNYSFFNADRAEQALAFAVSTALLWACSRFPTWPLHPIGVLFCQFSIGNLIWFSVFLGWLSKFVITRLFGGGVYRKARPVFLGLIMGELLAMILWTLVPIVIVLVTGADPTTVPRYVILQYP